MTSEWLLAIWPHLISAGDPGVVGIDPFPGIGSAVNVGGAKHDFCESGEAGAHTCRFRANDVLHWIACWPGDDAVARIGFDRRREKTKREGCLGRRGEHLECKRAR